MAPRPVNDSPRARFHALARGALHCIGATMLDEYRKHIEEYAALARGSSRRSPSGDRADPLAPPAGRVDMAG